MLTETHRWTAEGPALAFLPTNALTAGIDFVRYFASRAWMLEARGVVSQVSGEREAIQALQTNPVHYYQRPGTTTSGSTRTRRRSSATADRCSSAAPARAA